MRNALLSLLLVSSISYGQWNVVHYSSSSAAFTTSDHATVGVYFIGAVNCIPMISVMMPQSDARPLGYRSIRVLDEKHNVLFDSTSIQTHQTDDQFAILATIPFTLINKLASKSQGIVEVDDGFSSISQQFIFDLGGLEQAINRSRRGCKPIDDVI